MELTLVNFKYNPQSNNQIKEGQIMLKLLQIRREKNKLKLKLLKHASYCLERNNNPELLRAVAELLRKVN